MLCLVSDELLQLSVPTTLLQSPIEADAAEPIDAILRKRISQVGYPLMAYPLSKLSLSLRNVAVAMLCLVFDELVESSVPFFSSPLFEQRPLEADAAEPIDATLRKRASLVSYPLSVHPRSKLSLLPGSIAVAVLRSITE